MNAEQKKVLREKTNAGVKAAVASALEEHRRAGRKVAIWRDGRVQLVLPPPPQQGSAASRDKSDEA
ncbi:MAG TPA: hypothetical protein VFC44_11505 [Candidatus Saccharimonadales bacterium]|nr:hypothetical protein [Candidatus Saccharimonadales bacterium]